jgi:hypothetical protein
MDQVNTQPQRDHYPRHPDMQQFVPVLTRSAPAPVDPRVKVRLKLPTFLNAATHQAGASVEVAEITALELFAHGRAELAGNPEKTPGRMAAYHQAKEKGSNLDRPDPEPKPVEPQSVWLHVKQTTNLPDAMFFEGTDCYVSRGHADELIRRFAATEIPPPDLVRVRMLRYASTRSGTYTGPTADKPAQEPLVSRAEAAELVAQGKAELVEAAAATPGKAGKR